MLAQLNLVLWAWMESLRDLGRFRIWRPFLLLALVQTGVVLLLSQFYRPGFSVVLAPLVEGLTGPGALHYPQFFLALPVIFSKVNFLIDGTVGSLCIGVAMLVVWSRIAGQGNLGAWSIGRRRLPALILVRLPLLVLLYLLAWEFPRLLFTDGADVSGSQVRLLRYASFLVGALIETFFVYAPVFLLLERTSVARAWKDGIAFLGRIPVASLLAVLIPSAIQIPTSYVLRRADRIVDTLSPEIVLFLVIGAIFIFSFVNFIIVGSVVRLYGARGTNPGGGLSWS